MGPPSGQRNRRVASDADEAAAEIAGPVLTTLRGAGAIVVADE
jgi:hypothetical protein